MAEPAVRDIGGGVDDDVDTAERRSCRLDERAAIGVAGDVGGETVGDAARFFDLGLHILGIGNGARAKHDVGTRRCKRLGDPAPDAAPAAGDDDRLAAEIFHHETPSNRANNPGADGFIDGVRGKSAT